MKTMIRIHLTDDSFTDIRYPIDTDYSFHWQRDKEILGINTAPDHLKIETFPRHLHKGPEVKTDTDNINDMDLSHDENLRSFMSLVREELAKIECKAVKILRLIRST